jgi:ATP-dependent helicase/nuclease subunit A
MRDVLKSGYNTYRVSPLQLTKKASEETQDGMRRRAADRPLTEEEKAIYDEIDRRFRYVYPDEELLTAKAKYSVSAIRKEELAAEAKAAVGEDFEADAEADADSASGIMQIQRHRKRASAADIGTAYHRIMEFLDFTKACGTDGSADMDYIESRAHLLRENNAIEEEVYSSLDLSRIAAFFESSLGKRAAEAARRGSLRREKPFTLKTERNGRELLVQGVIDCCFEEDGRMVLIDYKSSYIRPDRPLEEELARIKDEYRVQIELYSEAVKKGTGKEVGEAYLYLLTVSEALSVTI